MITVQRLESHPDTEGNRILLGISVVIEDEQLAQFIELVQRGSNLWPDASPEIKEFADMVTNGRILQNYKAQDTSTSKIPRTPK